MQYMADLPGILKDLKELDFQPSFQPTGNTGNLHPHLTTNGSGNVHFDDTSSDDCSSLIYTPNSFDSLEFLDDLQPMDVPHTDSTSVFEISPARMALVQKVQALKDGLDELGKHLNIRLANGSTAIELPSIDMNTPVSMAYHFTR